MVETVVGHRRYRSEAEVLRQSQMDEASSGPALGAGWPTLAAGAKQAGFELTEHQVELFDRYLAGLSAWSGRANLVSASALADAERVLFLDSLALVPVLRREQPAAARLIDVGSGAGFPGLVLKLLLPELDVVLLEATRKKASFLTWMAEDLGLEGVQVRAERAEEAARDGALRDSFDVATARALGPLPVVLEIALPFCKTGGTLIAPRGASVAAAEAAACASAAAALGGRSAGVERPAVEGVAERTAIVVVEKTSATPPRFPRRTGIPAKRPLG